MAATQASLHAGCLVFLRVLSSSSGARLASEVSFNLPKGSILAISGPQGSGKSTVLRLAALREMPTAGHIVCFGRNVLKANITQLQGLRSQIGAVLEESRLIEEASVGYNLRCTGLVYGLRGSSLEGRVRKLFRLLDLPQNDPYIFKAKVCTLNQSLKLKLLVLRECLGAPGLLVFDRPIETLGLRLSLRFLLGIQEATQKPTSLLVSVQDPKALGVLQGKASVVQLD